MTNVFADLHTHSTASDGILSPEELVTIAENTGLEVLGLTDHDTIDGINPAIEFAKGKKVRIIPGIELSCSWEAGDISVHVIGLFFDHEGKSLRNLLEGQRKGRFRRALRILDLLEGLDITVEPLRKRFLASEYEKPLGRPHIARYLFESGAVRDFQAAFNQYLRKGAPAYVPKPVLLPEDGISAIHEAGGLAFIAHPGLISEWDEVWDQIRRLSLDGIEVYYSEHENPQTEFFANIARDCGYLISGGSDFHGVMDKSAKRLGGSGIDKKMFDTLELAAQRNFQRKTVAAA